jgi:methylthioribose-1-phosphate isomerase
MLKTLYFKNNKLFILDQRLLPHKIKYIVCAGYKKVAKAITDMAIRGAPAIGVCAAYGVMVASGEKKFRRLPDFKKHLFKAIKELSLTRPTAVNLFWALERMKRIIAAESSSVETLKKKIEIEAQKIFRRDFSINKSIGGNGARLFKKKLNILTHCNAGALACAGYGTAVGVIHSAHKLKKINKVFVDETRPYLQGARLTALELKNLGIPYQIITDNMAGYFMKKGEVDAIVVGADRITLAGDAANKIGTYSLSILAHYHKIPFYVAAPFSTIDFKTLRGEDIVIEERSPNEVLYINKKLIAPMGSEARHPAFDVTPAKFITGIITEKGVYKPQQIKHLAGKNNG